MDNILTEFKERMKITHSIEDDNLTRLLSFSVSYIESKCGSFDLDSNNSLDNRAKELVFERARYAYNDALEYFENNFLSEVFSLGIDMSDDYVEE